MRWWTLVLVILSPLASGCAFDRNPNPPKSEDEVLSNVVQLTAGFAKAGEAYFSPDMRWVVFQAVPPGDTHYQMYVAALRRQGDRVLGLGLPIRITPPNSRNTCGHFSPDGNTLIFSSTAGKEDPAEPAAGYQREGSKYRWVFSPGMEIYRVDGWLAAVAAVEPGKIANLAQHRLTENDVYDAEAGFSPDGKKICFTSIEDGNADVYVMNADGTGRVRITSADGYDGGAFFSPDGEKLVYRGDRQQNDRLQVFVAELSRDADGQVTSVDRERQLTRNNFVNWAPYWHPRGRHIIYTTSEHGHDNYELYLMRADGTNKTRITFTPGADILPVFSPDGQYLMWTSNRTSDGTSQIFIARLKLPKRA